MKTLHRKAPGRKLFCLCLLSSFISTGVACEAAEESKPSAETSAISGCPGAERVVRDFLYALKSLDSASTCAFLDDNILYQKSGLVDVRGKASVLEEIGPAFSALSQLRLQIHRLFRKGGIVVAERIQYQRVADPLPPGIHFGNPGAELTSRVIGFFEVNDECRITRWSDYYDVSGLQRKLGFPITYSSQ
jgi:limonene-1,2-epoxide hydrolase